MEAIILSFIYDPLTTTSKEKKSSRFSSNSEAFASELLENLEEMFTRYYMDDIYLVF